LTIHVVDIIVLEKNHRKMQNTYTRNT